MKSVLSYVVNSFWDDPFLFGLSSCIVAVIVGGRIKNFLQQRKNRYIKYLEIKQKVPKRQKKIWSFSSSGSSRSGSSSSSRSSSSSSSKRRKRYTKYTEEKEAEDENWQKKNWPFFYIFCLKFSYYHHSCSISSSSNSRGSSQKIFYNIRRKQSTLNLE